MKNIKKIVSILLVSIMLTGCVRMNADFNVDSKGNITGHLKYLVSEKFIKYTSTSKEDIIKSFKNEFKDMTDIKEVTEKIDDETYYGIEANSSKISEIEKTVKDGKITIKFPLKKLLGNNFKGSDASLYASYLSDAKKNGAQALVTFTMPAKPTTNYGQVSGHKVTIDLIDALNESKDLKDVEISSATKDNTGLYIGLGVGAVIIILVGVGFFFFKKKKGQSQNV